MKMMDAISNRVMGEEGQGTVRRVHPGRQERRRGGGVHGGVLPLLPLPLHRGPRARGGLRRARLPALLRAVAPGAVPRLAPPPPRRRRLPAPQAQDLRRLPQGAAGDDQGRRRAQGVRRRRAAPGAQVRRQRQRVQPDPGGRRGRRRGRGGRPGGRVPGLLPAPAAGADRAGGDRGARGRAGVVRPEARQVRGGGEGEGAGAAVVGVAARAHRPGDGAGREPGHDGGEAADAEARDAAGDRVARPRRPPLHRRLLRRRQAADAAAPDVAAGAAVGAADRGPPRGVRRRAGAGAGAERLRRRRAAQGHQGPRGPPRPQPRRHRHAPLRHAAAAAGREEARRPPPLPAPPAGGSGGGHAVHPRGDPHRRAGRRRAGAVAARAQGGAPGVERPRGARLREMPGRARQRGHAGGAPGARLPDGGDHGGVLLRRRAAGRGPRGRRRRQRRVGAERAARRDVRGGGAGAAGGAAGAAGRAPALALRPVRLPRPGVAGDGARRRAATAPAPAPRRRRELLHLLTAAAARPVRGDPRRGGVAAAGGAERLLDGHAPAVVRAAAGAAVPADAAAAGPAGRAGHGAERHAVAAQPAAATDANIPVGNAVGHAAGVVGRRRRGRGRAADADVGVARGGAAGEGGHHAQVHEPGERPPRLRERALLTATIDGAQGSATTREAVFLFCFWFGFVNRT
ncbi:spidroin-1-like isoform X2 [Triticum dicoccoides]|uniref:spidroin-1-like isoform X2 n=1 Tax=Triticum dicoccoides TaxID=85692 RepID=UPI00189045BC|nr:spidroin-1-like isoform X2 [Triticum dicoccoides]